MGKIFISVIGWFTKTEDVYNANKVEIKDKARFYLQTVRHWYNAMDVIMRTLFIKTFISLTLHISYSPREKDISPSDSAI